MFRLKQPSQKIARFYRMLAVPSYNRELNRPYVKKCALSFLCNPSQLTIILSILC